MSTSIYTYPWAITNPGNTTSQVRDIGIWSMTLATSYHAGKFIQPSDTTRRVYFPEDGAIYFKPYASYGRLSPQPWSGLADRDVLQDMITAGMPICGWTVLTHNSRLGMQHPEVVVRNAFDDGYIYSLCPSHPDVRHYAITLCRDLTTHYDLAGLRLESPGFLAYAHGYHHEFAQVPPNAWLDTLLALCFCDSCRSGSRGAGINMEALARHTRAAIDGVLASDADIEEAQAQDLLREWNEDADIVALHRWRADVVTSLVAQIQSEVTPNLPVKVIATTQRPLSTTYQEGGDLARLDAACDGLELPLYQPDAGLIAQELRYALARVPAERTSAILRPGWPDMVDEQALQQAIASVRQYGVQDLAFYNLSLLRPKNLGWLSRAVAQFEETHDV